MWERKFAEFKGIYVQCLGKCEASGQEDRKAFASFAKGKLYIMYGYCFLQLKPVLKPFVTRAMGSNAQREKEMGAGGNPYGYRGFSFLENKIRGPCLNYMMSISLS